MFESFSLATARARSFSRIGVVDSWGSWKLCPACSVWLLMIFKLLLWLVMPPRFSMLRFSTWWVSRLLCCLTMLFPFFAPYDVVVETWFCMIFYWLMLLLPKLCPVFKVNYLFLSSLALAPMNLLWLVFLAAKAYLWWDGYFFPN